MNVNLKIREKQEDLTLLDDQIFEQLQIKYISDVFRFQSPHIQVVVKSVY